MAIVIFFTVVLDEEPGDSVVVAIDANGLDEGQFQPDSVTFSTNNWDTQQMITVVGVDDEVPDGDIDYNIPFNVTSQDGDYNGIAVDQVAVRNRDNDFGLLLTSDGFLDTHEDGSFETFTLQLRSPPSGMVTIPITTASDEIQLSTDSLVFASGNYDTPQTVTVTGLDDAIDDGDQAFSLTIGPSSSSDPLYQNLGDTLSGSNQDDDTSSITVATAGNDGTMDTAEPDTSDSFTVVLTSEPTAEVAIPISLVPDNQVTPSTATLTFNSQNWNTPQTVTLSPIEDQYAEDTLSLAVALNTPSSSDPIYAGINPDDLAGTHGDDDRAGYTVVTAGNDGVIDTDEGGGDDSFTLVLNSRPYSDVVLSVTSSNPDEGFVSPSGLTFSTNNWNQPQTVTVTGVDDQQPDMAVDYEIRMQLTASDTTYNGLNPDAVPAVNRPINTPPSTSKVFILTEQNTASLPVTPVVEDPDDDDSHRFVVTNQAASGNVDNVSEAFIYTPGDPLYVGHDTFDYRVFDQQDASLDATGSVIVLPPEYFLLLNAWPEETILPENIGLINLPSGYTNESPEAVDDRVLVFEDREVTINALANDTDPNPIDELVITAVDPPQGGNANNRDSNITYRSNSGFSGLDQFDYTISDGRGGSAGATITVAVLPIAAGQSCSSARAIPYRPGDPAVTIFANTAGLPDQVSPCDLSSGQADAWFSLNIPTNAVGRLVIDTNASAPTANTFLGLYGADCGTPIDCNNDISGANRRSRITIEDLVPYRGQNLRILVESMEPDGAFGLSLRSGQTRHDR